MTPYKVTFEEIVKLDAKALAKIVNHISIKPKKKDRESLVSDVSEHLKSNSKYHLGEEGVFVIYDDEIGTILQDDTISKSEKFRRMYKAGFTNMVLMSKLTKNHYSFIHGVIERHKNSH